MFRDAASMDRQRNFRKGDGKGKKGFGKGKNPKPYSDKKAVFLAEDDDVEMEDVVDDDEAMMVLMLRRTSMMASTRTAAQTRTRWRPWRTS